MAGGLVFVGTVVVLYLVGLPTYVVNVASNLPVGALVVELIIFALMSMSGLFWFGYNRYKAIQNRLDELERRHKLLAQDYYGAKEHERDTGFKHDTRRRLRELEDEKN